MIHDISPLVSPLLAVWPGDSPLRREVLLDIERGDNITLSTLHSTVHLGAHADAPSHYGADAATIDQRPLDLYLGPCQVMRVPISQRSRILPEHLTNPIEAPRLLLATGTYSDPHVFSEDFAALSPELMHFLADNGVRLVGLDTPSVDLFDSKDLPSHHAALERDLAILEGLMLADVPEGLYELIALPLRLAGFDASPVRAVLRTLVN